LEPETDRFERWRWGPDCLEKKQLRSPNPPHEIKVSGLRSVDDSLRVKIVEGNQRKQGGDIFFIECLG
jgi:hypothetical protein